MVTVKDLVADHLEYTFAKEAWQPPLATAVHGLTAEQAAWKPGPKRHSIWQIVRHVLWWKRGLLPAWDGDPPDFERLTEEDWSEVTGDQAAWEADVQALHDLYAELGRRLGAIDEDGLQYAPRWYRQTPPQAVAIRLVRACTHDAYHAGQIQYLRALQGIPGDRFYTAAWDGEVGVLREILDAHPDLLNAQNADGWTALHIAAFAGQAAAVRFLLDAGADLHATSHNEMANTALHGAIAGWRSGRRTGMAALLLDHGADANSPDARGNTPLHLAAREGIPELIELLVSRGANVDARRSDGETPLRTAVREGRTNITELLRGRGGAE